MKTGVNVFSYFIGLNKFKNFCKILYFFVYRRLAKSTLLLIPLFGVNYVVFVYMREESQNDIFKDYKIFFDLGLGSFQVCNGYEKFRKRLIISFISP